MRGVTTRTPKSRAWPAAASSKERERDDSEKAQERRQQDEIKPPQSGRETYSAKEENQDRCKAAKRCDHGTNEANAKKRSVIGHSRLRLRLKPLQEEPRAPPHERGGR